MRKINTGQWKIFALLWLLFISVLFFLPGSALPKEGWFDKIFLDKWVHLGFFTILLFLWRFYFPPGVNYGLLLLAIAAIYGMGVELIQHFFVANRSFDMGDVAADMVGAFLGIWLWSKWYIKK